MWLDTSGNVLLVVNWAVQKKKNRSSENDVAGYLQWE
jgi:hypothetical protein